MRRRPLLAALPALCTVPVAAGGDRLAAAWALGDRWQVGWLRADGAALRIDAALEVPTRAHGVMLDRQGRLIVVARRPGDWLLRWDGRRAPQWHWLDGVVQFNGHAVLAGGRLLTTQTDLDGGDGRIGVHAAGTLAPLAAWPTGGRDPHQLLADGRHLWVANGGLETRPETGRHKRGLDRMDASLVHLDLADGRALGRWTLQDAQLSIRHLARLPGGALALALQAEHADPARRAAAPVLALFDGRTLRPVHAPMPLGGYGGDVAVDGAGRIRVSCPRAGGVAAWTAEGRWDRWSPLPDANALAGDWAGGHPAAAQGGAALALPGLRLDNHWRLA